MSILYVGLDPSRYQTKKSITHLPLIKPVAYRHPNIFKAFKQLPNYESVLLTSRSAVTFFFELSRLKQKTFYCVGEATAQKLRSYGVEPRIANTPTAEGVCELLATHLPASLFYPHACGARPVITSWLAKQSIDYLAFAFYETLSVIPDPVPSLGAFDEIVFTSPSTIRAFLDCYGSLPKQITLTAIGPVTEEYLRSTQTT